MNNDAWLQQVREVERRRWIILIPLALAFLIVYFHRVAAGVVSDSLMSEFNITRASEMGLLSSIYFYTYALLQLPAGILADTYGPRRTITLAVVVAACGAFAFGWAQTLPWLFGARLVVSVGVAFVYINIVKFYSAWFRTREFGTISGLGAFIGNAGTMLAATPLALMVESFGWRVSFHIIGLITLAVAVYCWIVVRDSPRDVGLPSIDEIEGREGVATAPGPKQAIGVWAGIRVVTVNRYSWPPFFASFGVYGVFMAFAGIWSVPYFMQVYGMSRVAAANYVVAMAVGYMIGGPILGYVSDRLRSRRIPYAVYTLLTLGAWLLFTVWGSGRPPEWALYPLCVVFGAGTSGVSLTLACAREVNPPEITGIATGIANIGAFAGTALIQPAFGWMLDIGWQGAINQGVKIYPVEAYYGAFWLCTGILVMACICTLLIKETRCVNVFCDLAPGRRNI